MPQTSHQALRVHYEVHGVGQPVVLLHGGTVNFAHNYAAFGWVQQLNARGFQVIGLDFRGHGLSEKPHAVSDYGTVNLAGDVMAVLDHLQLGMVHLVGYSLGTVVALHLLQTAPRRFGRAVLMATGDGLIGHPPHTFAALLPALAAVLARSEYPRDLPKHLAAYWKFVAATSGDQVALAALAQSSYPPLSPAAAARIHHPVLVVSGAHDPVLGRGPRLAAALGNARYLEVAGADHFSLAADPDTRTAVVDFLAAAPSAAPHA